MTDIPAPSRAGLLIFPGITALDMVGPWEVFLRIPGWTPLLIGRDDQPVAADGGLMLTPHATIADCPPLDLLLIPGGGGIDALLGDDAVLDFVRAQAAATAHGVASVCTGALLLGAAGLLRGTRATTHWASHDLLAILGAIPVTDRVVVDGRIASGGGVTAGIDIAVALAARRTADGRRPARHGAAGGAGCCHHGLRRPHRPQARAGRSGRRPVRRRLIVGRRHRRPRPRLGEPREGRLWSAAACAPVSVRRPKPTRRSIPRPWPPGPTAPPPGRSGS